MVGPPIPSGKRTIKFLCSYGGRILPRQTDGKLRYHGGDTRVLAVNRSISFDELLLKLGELCGTSVSHVRCQLPTEDLDALVSITSDEDLANLIEEYDRSPLNSSLKIRAFLSLPKSKSPITTPSSSSSSSSSPPRSLYASTSPSRPSIPCHHHRYPLPPPPSSARKIVTPHYGYYAPPAQHIYLVHNW